MPNERLLAIQDFVVTALSNRGVDVLNLPPDLFQHIVGMVEGINEGVRRNVEALIRENNQLKESLAFFQAHQVSDLDGDWNANTRDFLDKLAEKGTFHVKFSTAHPDVSIPDSLRKDPVCILKFSRLFAAGGNADLFILDDKITQSLSFNGRWFPCEVPFEAIMQMWNDSVSSSLRVPTGFKQSKPAKRPGLRLVTNDDLGPEDDGGSHAC